MTRCWAFIIHGAKSCTCGTRPEMARPPRYMVGLLAIVGTPPQYCMWGIRPVRLCSVSAADSNQGKHGLMEFLFAESLSDFFSRPSGIGGLSLGSIFILVLIMEFCKGWKNGSKMDRSTSSSCRFEGGCPKCGWTYAWNGNRCGHCGYIGNGPAVITQSRKPDLRRCENCNVLGSFSGYLCQECEGTPVYRCPVCDSPTKDLLCGNPECSNMLLSRIADDVDPVLGDSEVADNDLSKCKNLKKKSQQKYLKRLVYSEPKPEPLQETAEQDTDPPVIKMYWYRTSDGRELGPYTSKELKAASRAGLLTKDCFLSNDRIRWVSAKNAKKLFAT